MTTATAAYSSRIIKAGALLTDAKLLLREWDEDLDERGNLERFRATNLFGKASRSRLEDILHEFRRRYLLRDRTGAALRRFVREIPHEGAIDRILYYHAAKADPLIYDFAVEFLFEKRSCQEPAISLAAAADFLRDARRRSRTTSAWSEETLTRVAQGLLASTRDFGLLQGAVNKTIADPDLPLEAFLYIALRLRAASAGAALLGHRDWRLFLLSPPEVKTLLGEAAQRKFLTYESLGKIVRIDFPYAGPEALERLIDALVR